MVPFSRDAASHSMTHDLPLNDPLPGDVVLDDLPLDDLLLDDLLLELGCEDLPARYVVPLASALSRGVVEGLARRGVVMGQVASFATPRRIAVQISGVHRRQPDQSIERLGPAVASAFRDGQPTPAALGFARSCGVEFGALGQKDGKLHFARTAPGRATSELIPEIFAETLRQMDTLVPKRMRWGAGDETFVRPVEWLCCLFGADVVPLRRFGLDAGRFTFGHRFHAPDPITLTAPAAYAESLFAAKVQADVAARKALIRRQIEQQAASLGGYARVTEDLLDEVTALVEWPVAVSGHFEARFLELPPEVIVATVETNQRYFTVFADAAHTQLTHAFITVCNIESRDVSQVISGNERVVRPRLTDALFFWRQDLKKPLADYLDGLATVTYQKELGTMERKAQRIQTLAEDIESAMLSGHDRSAVVRAAALCKRDLVTRMVYEFPELQGVMGGYYASRSGEMPEVATAIREHYLPVQQGTAIPSTHVGQIVALADKADALAGIFAIGQKPTASKDPYALRRAALGVLRICIEGGLPLDLSKLLGRALELQPAGRCDAATLKELTDFVMERLRAIYESMPIEMFEAVRTLGITAPLDFDRRVRALQGFWNTPAAQSLAAAGKRARNVLKQAGLRQAADAGDAIDPACLQHAAEHALFAALQAAQTALAPMRGMRNYPAMLDRLAALKEPVDAFFAGVMVNADDPGVRANRLALLQQLDAMCREVADLSCLPG